MSIYEENGPADTDKEDVRARRAHTGATSSLDQELVVPDYESVETADPSVCIAGFKTKREKRERQALAIVVNALVAMRLVAMLVVAAMSHVGPDANPFQEDVDGTPQFTETGRYVYLGMFVVDRCVQVAIVSSGLPLEDTAAKFRWSAIAARQVPATSIALWFYFSATDVQVVIPFIQQYGWAVMAPELAVIFRYLVVGRFCFAEAPVQPNERNILMRRPTVYEHTIMTCMAFNQAYWIWDLYCIKEGQWDGKTVGRAGAMLQVFLQWAWFAFWWFKWGHEGLLGPRDDRGGEKSREDRFADAMLFGQLSFSVSYLLHYIFLFSDIPDNDEMVTVTGRLRTSDDWLRYLKALTPPTICFILFRKQIFGVLTALLQKKQRLQDGAFIAALLVDDGTDDLINEATELFRGVSFSKVTSDLLRSSKGTQADYALSHPCKLNGIDFFVSHSESPHACFVQSSFAARRCRSKSVSSLLRIRLV
eukprot:COSAG06_NODE_4489_length_4208_cov_40.282064_2_plen_478_part_00